MVTVMVVVVNGGGGGSIERERDRVRDSKDVGRGKGIKVDDHFGASVLEGCWW